MQEKLRTESNQYELVQEEGKHQPVSQPPAERVEHRSFSAVKEATVSFRNFNVACLLVFVLTSCFMTVFLGYLDGLLIAVFVVQFLFALANLIFYCVSDWKRQNWVRLRKPLIFAPFALLHILFVYDFYRFFMQLEAYNDQFSGAAAVPAQD